MTTPQHTYETVEGTPAVAYVAHEPRTIAHTVITDNTDLHMMTEIGDGVFVQWSTCRRCAERVADCTCKEGPQEPTYMKAWRDQRFKRDLNTRPEPSYEILPSVIAWLEERGYTITKSVDQPEATPDDDLPDISAQRPTYRGKPVEDAHLPDDEVDTTEEVNVGLAVALEKVRAARDTSKIDVDF